MAWWHLCDHCGGPDHSCEEVTCDRCGAKGWDNEFVMEEGDEWECPTCNERENQREKTAATAANGD